MELIKNLEWRYATKRFDPEKKVSPEHLAQLKKAMRLSVSSYGLQLYKVLIIEDKALREKLKPQSWSQDQITDASHLLVFCNYREIYSEAIDDFIRLTAEKRKTDIDQLIKYGDFIKMKLSEKSEAERKSWLEKQPYIALANLLMACAELKIDACPMEGFEPEQYNRILNLDKKNLNACVVATIGYRNSKDQTQAMSKVRKPCEALFELI